MRDDLFNDLLTSVEEATEIAGSERPLGRATLYKGKVLVEIRDGNDVKWSLQSAAEKLMEQLPIESLPLVKPSVKFIRGSLNQTQEGFAQLLGVGVDTVRGWEQGKRKPRGPAKTLLNIAAHNPIAVLKASGLYEEA